MDLAYKVLSNKKVLFHSHLHYSPFWIFCFGEVESQLLGEQDLMGDDTIWTSGIFHRLFISRPFPKPLAPAEAQRNAKLRLTNAAAVVVVTVHFRAKRSGEMNRLAVGRSARPQQAHTVNNRINNYWLMPLLKTDIDTQTTAMYVTIVLARDPPTRHLGRVFVHLDGFWRGGHLLKWP